MHLLTGASPGPGRLLKKNGSGGWWCGGSAGVASTILWVGAWLGPTLPTVVPPFGCGGKKRAQVFRLRKPVVLGCRLAWVTDVAPVSVRAREVLTPYAVAMCRSVALADRCPKPLCGCRACPVRLCAMQVPCDSHLCAMPALCGLHMCAMQALCDSHLCAIHALCDSHRCAMQALCDSHLCPMQTLSDSHLCATQALCDSHLCAM